MWSPDLLRRARGIMLVLAVPLVLSGCLRPLHGEAASGGLVQDKLAAIVVDQVPDRIGHYVVQELRFDLDGSGATVQPRYRLSMTLKETVNTAIVSSLTGRAENATVLGDVTYTLKPVGSDTAILTGRAFATASYDRNEQRFAAVRAARDAEIRVAKQLAEQIRTRLAAYFATKG